MFAYFFTAVSLGMSAGMIPGPLQAYLIGTTLRYGRRRGVLVVLSPLITDVPIILLMTFLLDQLPSAFLSGIRFVGGLILWWIAWQAWRAFQSGASFHGDQSGASPTPETLEDNQGSARRILGMGVMMNAFSPGPYLFWGTITGPLLLEALEQSVWHGGAFLLGFYGTFLGFLTLLVIAFHRIGQFSPRLTRGLLLLVIALLLWFGGALILEALREVVS